MKRIFASIVLSLVGLAIFVLVSIFGMGLVSVFTENIEVLKINKPIVFVIAVLISSLPWVFAAYLTADEDWRTSTKLLYFLPVYFVTPSFIMPAMGFAIVFVLARMHYIKRGKDLAVPAGVAEHMVATPDEASAETSSKD